MSNYSKNLLCEYLKAVNDENYDAAIEVSTNY